jgi:hypothetical protein
MDEKDIEYLQSLPKFHLLALVRYCYILGSEKTR